MKTNHFLYGKPIFRSIIAVLFIILFNFCKPDPTIVVPKSDQLVIADYIASKPDQYSDFGKLLTSTKLDGLLSIRGPFTLFLPTNDAMAAYCKLKGVNSVLDFDTITQKNLVYNHLISTEIQSGDIGEGALREENALGNKLATEFEYIGDKSNILINKESRITDRDIRCANGFIHEIDRVIEPVTIDIYQLVASNPSYSLFAKGLEITGLKDTLQITNFFFGSKAARTKFTVLAVPDTIYNRYGINTIDDLIKYFTNDPNNVKDLSNDFYRYMEYHCMGGAYYFTDFEKGTKLYPILSSDNNISVTIDTEDYKLNYNKKENSYTGFIKSQSNIPAKNGALHTVNGLFPVFQPAPTVILFETTHYFDLEQGDYFQKYYKKWFDGKNDLAKIKWEGDYLMYYYKNHDTGTLLNDDCLTMQGFWWCEITTPKIMKGNYSISGNLWSGQVDYDVYVDGVKTATVLRGDQVAKMGDVYWETTAEHKIKVVALTYGGLFWDTVTFTPIN